MQLEEATNKLAKIIATQIVNDRERVVDFLRFETDYIVHPNATNGFLASVLSKMVFDPDEHEKLQNLLETKTEYKNAVGATIAAIVAIVGSGVAITADIRQTQEARESAISGLTLQQIDYDKALIENRQRMTQEFYENVIKNEREIQEQKRQMLAKERQQKIVYFVAFVAVLTASFTLLTRKK